MSALGQKQTSEHAWIMSALPPKADIAERECHVRFVPKADVSRCSKATLYSITSSARSSKAGGTITPSAFRLTALGQQVVPREQQSSESLRMLQKHEIEKWWPIIKAAGIKAD
jgi:hypothetical protein